ncbi:MAG TPA: N-acetyltransferase [Phycisphaerae bacterium]|nr:N-acetyltransferase [Phycisphaerae bacterium]
MAAEPIQVQPTGLRRLRLERFRPGCAPLVASWVRDAREAYWLAPHSPPPITPASVLGWASPGRRPFQLVGAGAAPVAYGEINVLNAERAEYWLGHLIVDPAQRGRRHGVRLVRELVRFGFAALAASRISLVVFEDNENAIACYRSAGMRDDGREFHRFAACGTSASLLRMAVSRGGPSQP